MDPLIDHGNVRSPAQRGYLLPGGAGPGGVTLPQRGSGVSAQVHGV